MGELIALTLMLTVLAAPLIFGLQRFGVFRPRLWQILLVALGVSLVLALKLGDRASHYVGYFIAIPLFGLGLLVLAASFFMKKKAPEDAPGSGEAKGP